MLRQTHAVDAVTAVLTTIKNYATNHNGQSEAERAGLKPIV